jgi:predicted ATP-grasp superfamily ATP-dependent carboligase
MFEYRGGELMTEPHLVARAHRLALRTLASLPATRGYVGIDLIIGSDANGGEDVVIEVNPRLTTSYVGLRHRVRPNLGEAMWQLATGRPAHLSFLQAPLQFDADGAVRSTNTLPCEIQNATEQVL